MKLVMAIKYWCYSLYICWCLMCSFNQITCLQNETDRLALISLKESIQEDPFGILDSWNDSLQLCDWYGVSCSRRHPDRIIALNLNSQSLGGSLSPHIGNLSFLRGINLKNNSFRGQIPQEIGRLRRLQYIDLSNNSFQGNIPTNLSHCSNLVSLNLIDNKLKGNVPSELGALSNLRQLGLSINKLMGPIPPSLGNLSSLWMLSIGRNGLNGQIPEEISRLFNLEYFIVFDNFLTGEIPPGVFNISSMNVLMLSRNQFYGNIPSNIGLTLPQLTTISLSKNNFSGPLPISLSNASKLVQIVFSENLFTGLIPRDLGKLSYLRLVQLTYNKLEDDLSFIDSLTNCSSLKYLVAADNFLRGPIPASLANLSIQMTEIDLSDNPFQGMLPMGIETLVNLRFFQLENNNLTGLIHINFKKFQRLEGLSLFMNKFIGPVPSSISNLPMLTYLYLHHNNLNGSIPLSLVSNCNNLLDLDLSYNSLSGSIPKEVMSISSLSILLSLAHNQLSGEIPSEIGMLQNLLKLDLSDNRLSGIIPKSIGECSSLEGLYLNGNSFEGELPQALSALHGLRELDISGNNFSGLVPESLADLDGLAYLNLSFNQLQGEVPKHGIFLNASATSLLGNNGLCGGISELKLPPCLPPNSKKNNLSIALKVIIPVVAVILLLLLAFFLIFWKCRRKSRKRNTSMPLLEDQFLRISYAELFKATNGFSMDNIIGVGGYGSVFKGNLEELGMLVAVKVLNMQQRGASSSFMSECEALRSIRHRNLLKLLSVCSSIDFQGNDFKALIYEFMPNGSLENWLHMDIGGEDGAKGEPRKLKMLQRLNIAADIATAIEYLHNGSSTTIVHGDLKPSNVLLDEEMTSHIGDFGLAKIVSSISDEFQQQQSTSRAIKGSVGYIAPEYGMGDTASVKGDVYSYGILLLEMFTGKKPTDQLFKEDLNLHTFVEGSLPDKVMDIVDPTILSEDEIGRFMVYITSVLRIGVACSVEQPRERMEVKDAISELQKIKSSYQKEILKQRLRRNAYQIGGPSGY